MVTLKASQLEYCWFSCRRFACSPARHHARSLIGYAWCNRVVRLASPPAMSLFALLTLLGSAGILLWIASSDRGGVGPR